MGRLKIACISSDTPKAIEGYKELSRKINFFKPEEAEIILVLGGDGFMLHALHTFHHLNIPYYGMNCGTYGFLMNEYNEFDLIERIRNSKEQTLFPLKKKSYFKNDTMAEAIAFNEVSLIRHSRQSANLRISINGVERISNLVCDGILLATPAGSTAYNFSARGPIIPLGSNVLALTPVSPFRPRRWSGALLPHTAQIKFENLDPVKRPLYVSADFKEWPEVVSVEIEEVRNLCARLLFDPNHTLDDRIFSEQFAYGE